MKELKARAVAEVAIIAAAIIALVFHFWIDLQAGRNMAVFVSKGARHTASEAQCDCEAQNEIRREIGMRERNCTYGVCAPSGLVKQELE